MLTLSNIPAASKTTIDVRVWSLGHLWPAITAKAGNRLYSAQVIASTPGTIVIIGSGLYQVRSQSNPLGSYQVDVINHTCSCPDHGKHASDGVICKHRLAVALAFGWASQVDEPPLSEPWVNSLHTCADLVVAYDRILATLETLIAHLPGQVSKCQPGYTHLDNLRKVCLDRLQVWSE